MAEILVSGLLNVETSAKVRGFPINYYPIDYAFFGVNTAPGGVGFNLASALKRLGSTVTLCGLIADDFGGRYVSSELESGAFRRTQSAAPLRRPRRASFYTMRAAGVRSTATLRIYRSGLTNLTRRLWIEPK